MATTSNKEILQQRLRLGTEVTNYANAHPTAKYSIADFRIIYNISDEDMKYLQDNHSTMLDLIKQKAKLNLRTRLLDPEIKAAEVGAIRAYLELEEGHAQSTSHTYNIQFAKTAEDMANIIDPSREEKIKNKK